MMRTLTWFGLLITTVSQAVPAQPSLVAPTPVWTPLPELHHREQHALAYDWARQQVVMFGGHVAPMTTYGTSDDLNDTWVWDGSRWELRTPTVSPPPRVAHAMAFDPFRGEVILIGGADYWTGTPMADMWAWDGQTWKLLANSTPLGPRYAPAVCTDPTRARVVLFGGAGPGQTLLSDTWEWDGSQWQQRFAAAIPDARRWGSMAFCALNQRVVLYGGDNFGSPFTTDTWDWDGSTWTKYVTQPNPNYRVAPMATDPVSGRVLLHGGITFSVVNDTWEWDGSVWRQVGTSMAPAPRQIPQLATDLARGKIVLFGGRLTSLSATLTGRDTWTWDGIAWTQVADWVLPQGGIRAAYHAARDETLLVEDGLYPVFKAWVLSDGTFRPTNPAQAPPARLGPYVAPHAGSGKVILFGGVGWRGGSYNDTWLWDGTTWAQYGGPVNPPASGGALVYDSHRDRTVFIVSDSDLWEWDGTAWTTMPAPKPRPTGGINGLAAYDPGRRSILLVNNSSTYTWDTWEWNGTVWRQHQPTACPSFPRRQMQYDPRLGGIVLFGGGTPPVTDTWLWDGQDWVKLHPGDLPDEMWARASAYDSARREVIAIYGFDTAARSGIWRLAYDTCEVTQPYPRPGEATTLSVKLDGQGGNPLVLGLSTGTYPSVPVRTVRGLGTEVLPLLPDPLLAWSLQAGLVLQLDRFGRGSLTVGVPPDPRLIGVKVHAAGFTVDPLGQVGAITNAAALQVVR